MKKIFEDLQNTVLFCVIVLKYKMEAEFSFQSQVLQPEIALIKPLVPLSIIVAASPKNDIE